MKQLIAVMAFIMVSQAYAQDVQYVQPAQVSQPAASASLPKSAPKKRTMLYDEQTNKLVEVSPEVQPQAVVETAPAPAAGAPQASATGANPIVILNNQRVQGTQAANQVQELPPAVIEEAPLKSSPADGLRKKRQATEAGTEDGIVQALEKARMDDEIKRRDRFNQAIIGAPAPAPEVISQPTAPQYPAYQPPAQVAPAPAPVVQQVTPVPVVIQPVVEKEKEEDKVDIKAEIREALKENEPKKKDPQTYYVGAQVGTADYANTINVRGNLSSGVTLGVMTPERFIYEANFLYSTFQIDDVLNYGGGSVDMKQYNIGGTLKYSFLPGRIRPMIGVAGTYVRRSYSEFDYEFRNSNSFDIGAVAGLDVAVSDNFAIGVDVRYFFNVANNGNDSYNSYVQYQPWGTKNIEQISYYTAALVGKFTF